jgi:hypothetical protein
MIDANTSMLNKFLAENEKKEIALKSFEELIDDRLCEIKAIMEELQKEAQNYDGYPFIDELDEYLKDLV